MNLLSHCFCALDPTPSYEEIREMTTHRLINLHDKSHTPQFKKGDYFWIIINRKVVRGIVENLRDDTYEQANSHPFGNYHYSEKYIADM